MAFLSRLNGSSKRHLNGGLNWRVLKLKWLKWKMMKLRGWILYFGIFFNNFETQIGKKWKKFQYFRDEKKKYIYIYIYRNILNNLEMKKQFSLII